MSHAPLLDARVWTLLLEVDRELAAETRARGCGMPTVGSGLRSASTCRTWMWLRRAAGRALTP